MASREKPGNVGVTAIDLLSGLPADAGIFSPEPAQPHPAAPLGARYPRAAIAAERASPAASSRTPMPIWPSICTIGGPMCPATTNVTL